MQSDKRYQPWFWAWGWAGSALAGSGASPITGTASCGSDASDVWTLDCFFPLIGNLIYWLLVFSGTVALVIIIISGIRLILSGGEAKSVETAKKGITWALLGLLLVFFAILILNVIGYVTGVACLNINNLSSGFQSCQTLPSGPLALLAPPIPAMGLELLIVT